MSTSNRDTIITNLATLLGGIATPTYRTNAGSKVYVWRSTPVLENDTPAVNIEDFSNTLQVESSGNLSAGYYDLELAVRITGYTSSSDDPASEARSILYDVLEILATDDTLSGACWPIQYQSDFIKVDQEERKQATVEILLSIKYRTNKLSGT